MLNSGIILGDIGLGWALLATDELLCETGSPQLFSSLAKVIAKLAAQIGQPYRWDGQAAKQGFDYSGLIWFTFPEYVNWPIPRTGLSIRISQLNMPFWQQHYAGARRVLSANNLRE